jgi:hypothetical protein
MGGMYFGLIAALVVLMYVAQVELQSIPHPSRDQVQQIAK